MMSTVVCLIVCSSIAAVRTLLGFFTMSWVTPGDARRNSVLVSRGRAPVNVAAALSKSEFGGGGPPIGKGRMLLASMRGPESSSNALPWARITVPCGIDAMRTTLVGTSGSVVGRDDRPDARLDVQAPVVLGLLDLLQVGQTEHVDVGHQQPAVRDRAADLRERERLARQVQLEEAVLVGGQLVRAPDRVESGALPGSHELRERAVGIDRRRSIRRLGEACGGGARCRDVGAGEREVSIGTWWSCHGDSFENFDPATGTVG